MTTTEPAVPSQPGGVPAPDPDVPWWRDAVIYQVYLRSFADGDNDGVGDLPGLAQRLDHLVRLGVDGLWLNPCYPSPGADHGYDVADYTDVDPLYGGLAAFDELLAATRTRRLKLLMDLVPNHCSVQHPWFQAALAAPPGSPERERFLFRTGRGPGGCDPPNNWRSVFGGPAWTRVGGSDQWYLHSFDASQPDFNWRNPQVADYFADVLRFWFDRGVDGFRIDVAHMLVKHPDLPDWPYPADGSADFNAHSQHQPEVHEVFRRWRRLADSYGCDLTLVGEIWVPTVADLAAYLRPGELTQAFYFDLLTRSWDAGQFRASIDRGLAEIADSGGPVTWVLANHDVHRAVTRFGLVAPADVPGSADPVVSSVRARGKVDTERGLRRARAAALLLLALPGSVYLYQGEELGLPEVLDLPDEARQDPIWRRSGGAEHGRDGCRVPLPWDSDATGFGFSLGDAGKEPWLPQPEWFGDYAVDAQWRDPASTVRLHARALQLRKQLRPMLRANPECQWLPVPGRPDVLAMRRGALVCVTVFGSCEFRTPPEWGPIRLASAPVLADGSLPAESSAWLMPE